MAGPLNSARKKQGNQGRASRSRGSVGPGAFAQIRGRGGRGRGESREAEGGRAPSRSAGWGKSDGRNRGRRRLSGCPPGRSAALIAAASAAITPPRTAALARPRNAPGPRQDWAGRQTTLFSMVPIFSTSQVTTSPAFRNTGGCIATPTPLGVPVARRSPGSSVKACDR